MVRHPPDEVISSSKSAFEAIATRLAAK